MFSSYFNYNQNGKENQPTNNNLRISSNTSRANHDNSPRTNKGTGYDNQRAVNVAGAMEMQESGIRCYNCKEYRHVARECQKPKQEKDAAYHKEKIQLYKQEEAKIQLSDEQLDWRDHTDDELEDRELEAHYLYMAKIQEVTPDAAGNSGPVFDAEPLQKLIEIILFIVDSRYSKHTMGNLKLQGNDLLIGSRGTDLYSITLQNTTSPNPICFMAKASSSQAWLWHRRLSHLNFDTVNLLLKYDIMTGLPKLKFVKDYLYSSCELGKAKRKSFKTKTTPSSKRWLQILHMVLYGLMRVESINGKKYVPVIIDDYSRYTWTHFLRSKDETHKVLIDFLKLVQRGLNAQVRTVRTDKGTKFLNKPLHAYFAQEGIEHQTSTARTMLSAAKVPC
ncbi:retrovirus-related pol polyprotein from transposon TNT 1-94 [Tanacetum coccineum]